MIGILVPKSKASPELNDRMSYKINKKQEVITKHATSDLLEKTRKIFSYALVFLAYGLIWIAMKVDSEHDIDW